MLTSISSRITYATLALVLLCSSAFIILSMSEHQRVYQQTMMSNLDALSDNLSVALIEYLGSEQDHLAISTKLLDLEKYQHVQYALIYNLKGEVISAYIASRLIDSFELSPESAQTLLQDNQLGTYLKHQDIIAYKHIGETNFPVGYLLIVSDYQKPLQQSHYSLLVNSLPVAGLIVLIIVMLAIWINRMVFKPLYKLTQFADSIDPSANFEERFHYQGKDEVGKLADSFNAMLARIKSESDKSQRYTQELKAKQNTLTHMANFDTLTGLPNRKYFMEQLCVELSKAERKGENVIVLFLDLDNFKSINDSLGHKTGDLLLVNVSKLIKKQLRGRDVLARLGGDEFLILLTDVQYDLINLAINVASRIIASLQQPLTILEWEVQTGVSIGVADAKSANYQADLLISDADLAMYRAKESGRNQVSLFKEELQAQSLRKLHIGNSISKGLEQCEFEIHYQIKVGLNGEINGLEALLRWNSAFDGVISPAEFIPIAEHCGRISTLSQFVIEKVFSDLAHINTISHSLIVVSLNLSAHDIKDTKTLSLIRRLMNKYHIMPQQIEFEVTESAYLDNFKVADAFFKEINEMGFLIALDDFGTGYSSLSYLTQIPMHTLKIDKQFIDAMTESKRDKLIIDTIIKLAHQLDLNVCAEGVEHASQKDYLQKLNCQQLQGYFFSKPVPLNQLSGLFQGVLNTNSTVQLVHWPK